MNKKYIILMFFLTLSLSRFASASSKIMYSAELDDLAPITGELLVNEDGNGTITVDDCQIKIILTKGEGNSTKFHISFLRKEGADYVLKEKTSITARPNKYAQLSRAYTQGKHKTYKIRLTPVTG